MTGHVPPFDRIGGVERYTYDLARGLHELGHDVHVVAWHDAPIRQDGPNLTVHGIGPADLDDRVGFGGWPVLTASARFAVAAARRVAALQQAGGAFDVVHASNWNACGAGVLRAGMAPVVLMLVTPLSEILRVEGRAPDDDLRLAVALDRWQIEHADAVCCPSWGVLDTYERGMALELRGRPRVHCTPLGIAPAPAMPPAAPPTGPRRLLFVGRLDPRKGIHVLLDVLPRLLARHPEWRCDLVGDDQVLVPGAAITYRARFTAAHARAPWRDRVRFHGAVDDPTLARLYAECDVFVAPSLFESFGLIYLEAMQFGKPVVGCRVGGVPDVVRDGVDGILVEPGSADALATALDRLMSDAALRTTLGRAGRARVHGDFDHRAMATRLLDVYERVIADRSRSDAPARSGDADAALARVLDTIAAHATSAAGPCRTHRLRELLQAFRREPVGGRLVPLKRIVHWFVASAFDRQTKVHEAILAGLVEVEQEIAQLRLDQQAARQIFDDRSSGGGSPAA